MKKILAVLCAMGVPALASAHAKWLVPEYQTVIDGQHGTYQFYALLSFPVFVWIIASLCIVLLTHVLQYRLPEPTLLVRFGNAHQKVINQLAQFVLGVFLVSTALFWNVIILPTEAATLPLLIVLKYIQVVIGVLFILHIAPRYASMALLALSVAVTATHGVEAVLENIVLFSLALYFYLTHTKTRGVWQVLKKYRIDIVRIGVGVSLIALAFTEKLLYPELSMQFLAVHHWNFMQPLFPWFSNELFVLSTGMAELLFGVIFILGYLTRITTITIAIFFALSVSAMWYQSQVWEVEDFVVYCAAILLFFFSHTNTTLVDMVRKVMRRTK